MVGGGSVGQGGFTFFVTAQEVKPIERQASVHPRYSGWSGGFKPRHLVNTQAWPSSKLDINSSLSAVGCMSHELTQAGNMSLNNFSGHNKVKREKNNLILV